MCDILGTKRDFFPQSFCETSPSEREDIGSWYRVSLHGSGKINLDQAHRCWVLPGLLSCPAPWHCGTVVRRDSVLFLPGPSVSYEGAQDSQAALGAKPLASFPLAIITGLLENL